MFIYLCRLPGRENWMPQDVVLENLSASQRVPRFAKFCIFYTEQTLEPCFTPVQTALNFSHSHLGR